jgi:hypothetical protein
MAGTLTVYDSGDAGCSPQTFSRVQGFFERANHVHRARNEGTTPVLLYATFLGAPPGPNPTVSAKRPSNCAA